ncbi:MAG: redoxin domain-containing protein [Alphaproteobacteria bacterium]|nr:MAG: redoxin domain-containing protein [Alphaproteobacteria bacterium]
MGRQLKSGPMRLLKGCSLIIQRILAIAILGLCLVPFQTPHAEGTIPTLNTASFVNTVKYSSNPVLIEFMANWCPFCKKQQPHIEALRNSMMGKLDIYQVNVDEDPGISAEYDAHVLPTLMIFYHGEVVGKSEGALYGSDLTGWVEDVQNNIRSRKGAYTNDSQAL